MSAMEVGDTMIRQGAEARVYLSSLAGRQCIVKERFSKGYRHPELDKKLTFRRTSQEARCIGRCRAAGIPTPALLYLDVAASKLYLEYIDDALTIRDFLWKAEGSAEQQTEALQAVGRLIARMHKEHVIHGDLTTSNMMRRNATGEIVMIDFGLSVVSQVAEDKAVDLYVLERAFVSTHPNAEEMFAVTLEAYTDAWPEGAHVVLKKLEDVRARGRKRDMLG